METKHTKGEWQVNSQQNLIICGKKWIADLSCKGFELTNEEEMKANAKLIAAAPELLEALLKTKLILDKLILPNERAKNLIYQEVTNAIKKATE